MPNASGDCTYRHTCPQCGDILTGQSEDALVAEVVAHCARLHDQNLFDLISESELRASIQREYDTYWAHVERLIPKGLPTLLEARLPEREREIVAFVVHGYTNKEIARRLSISPRTVSTHLVHIYDKLNVHSRAALVAMVRAADRTIEAGIHAKRETGFGPFDFPSEQPDTPPPTSSQNS